MTPRNGNKQETLTIQRGKKLLDDNVEEIIKSLSVGAHWHDLEPIHKIDFSYNEIKRFPNYLPSTLQGINLSFNRIISIPSNITALTHLIEIRLRGNRIRHLPLLTAPGPISLRYLDIAHNELEEVSGLEAAENLQTLLLEGNRLSSLIAIRSLSLNRSLRELSVNDNPIGDVSSHLLLNICPHLAKLNGSALPSLNGGPTKIYYSQIFETSRETHLHLQTQCRQLTKPQQKHIVLAEPASPTPQYSPAVPRSRSPSTWPFPARPTTSSSLKSSPYSPARVPLSARLTPRTSPRPSSSPGPTVTPLVPSESQLSSVPWRRPPRLAPRLTKRFLFQSQHKLQSQSLHVHVRELLDGRPIVGADVKRQNSLSVPMHIHSFTNTQSPTQLLQSSSTAHRKQCSRSQSSPSSPSPPQVAYLTPNQHSKTRPRTHPQFDFMTHTAYEIYDYANRHYQLSTDIVRPISPASLLPKSHNPKAGSRLHIRRSRSDSPTLSSSLTSQPSHSRNQFHAQFPSGLRKSSSVKLTTLHDINRPAPRHRSNSWLAIPRSAHTQTNDNRSHVPPTSTSYPNSQSRSQASSVSKSTCNKTSYLSCMHDKPEEDTFSSIQAAFPPGQPSSGPNFRREKGQGFLDENILLIDPDAEAMSTMLLQLGVISSPLHVSMDSADRESGQSISRGQGHREMSHQSSPGVNCHTCTSSGVNSYCGHDLCVCLPLFHDGDPLVQTIDHLDTPRDVSGELSS